MTDDDEWVKVAMTDDTVVVELLIRLNQSSELLLPVKRTAPAPPLEWTVRQRRSKPVPRIVGEDTKGDSTRASPTTPLSWSGGTSVSGGGSGGVADGYEESSRHVNPSDGARSKVIGASETTTTKRSRKKKTLLELREEESLLLKERKHLKKELASLRCTVEKQRATNESLKRMKFDMQLQSAAKTVATSLASEQVISGEDRQLEATCDPIHSNLPTTTSVAYNDLSAALHQPLPNGSSKLQKDIMSQEKLSLLPDLNMPCEEVSGSDVLYGIS